MGYTMKQGIPLESISQLPKGHGEDMESHTHYLLNNSEIPKHDLGLTTRKWVLTGLYLSWFIGSVCIIGAIYIFANPFSTEDGGFPTGVGHLFKSNTGFVLKIIPLCLTLLVTACIESMGYVHSVCLRWILWSEDRLQSNTNLRLFSCSRRNSSNGRFANSVYMLSVITSYAAASQSFFVSEVDGNFLGASGPMILVLGLSFFGQATLVTWSLSSAKDLIKTWSSNPIEVALARRNTDLKYHPGRCMIPVQGDIEYSPLETTPSHAQPSMAQTYKWAKYVLYGIWLVFGLTVLWTIVVIIAIVARGIPLIGPDPFPLLLGSILPSGTFNGKEAETSFATFGVLLNDKISGHYTLKVFLILLFVMAIQAYLTIGLHCADLIINMSRDEDAWRRASQKGIRRSVGSIKSALKSWQTVLLFTFKVISHWLFGHCLLVGQIPTFVYGPGHHYYYMDMGISFPFSTLYLLAILMLLLAIFVTILAVRKPKGPQPAAWGNLQTLVNLIDEWSESDQAMFWGDKTTKTSTSYSSGLYLSSSGRNDTEDIIRHAGTSTDKSLLGEIKFGCQYEGSS